MAEGATLLVVDDQAEYRTLLARFMQSKGYRVFTAESGNEALAVLGREKVDLVLLDLWLGDLSGIEVVAKLRVSRPALDLPVIMVSGMSDSDQVVEALRAGANDYIAKPVDLHVCLARVEGQLARRLGAQAPPAPFRADVGGTVAQYRLLEVLGEGGMGRVFRAQDTKLDRTVALKVLQGERLRGRPEAVQRFLREARAVARVRHPNVVGIFDVGEEPCHYLAMECVDGGTLEERVKSQVFDLPEATRIALEVAEALVAIHGCGVIHRDLKPANVLFDRKGGIRVTDFGLALVEGAQGDLTRQGMSLGTPTHMAPEQVDPAFGTVGPATDLWALGAILYEMLTGRLPFQGSGVMQILNGILTRDPTPPRKLRPEIPPDLEQVCLRALRRDPQERFGSAREMREALNSCLEAL